MNSRFYLSRKERRRLICLLFILILVFAVRLTWENAVGDATIQYPTPNPHHSLILKGKEESYYAVPEPLVESFPFDPNEADSNQFLRLGLTPVQVRSIYRHRARGYRYHSAEDFMYTPFLTNQQWQHLHPLIRISDSYRLVQPPHHHSIPNPQSPTYNVQQSDTAGHPRWVRHHKVSPGTLVDVNTADSATLCTVPGIGPFWAARILRLRNRYGGFASIHQLADEPNFPHSSLVYLAVTPDGGSTTPHAMRCLSINDDSFQHLVDHPYLTYAQVKTIKDFQRKYGRLHTMHDLLALPGFTPDDTLRLKPYVEF